MSLRVGFSIANDTEEYRVDGSGGMRCDGRMGWPRVLSEG
jgi:hypothetical protein